MVEIWLDAPEGHKLHHCHELSLCSVGDDGEDIECGLCKRGVDRKSGDPEYVCKSSCGYVVHKSCGDLPLQTNHSFHDPSHGLLTLTLQSWWIQCFSCFKYYFCPLFYECLECDFRMDVECALLNREEAEAEESIQHTTHPHPLLPSLDHHNQQLKRCFLCKLKLSYDDEAYYGCVHCNYFLHKSCAHLPLEFSPHPLHPHRSTLSLFNAYKFGYFTCDICKIKIHGRIFYFKCGHPHCSFKTCWKCIISVKKKNIKYEDHDHFLCFVDEDEAKKIDHCSAYDAYCTRPDLINIVGNSKEFERTASSMFKCLECDFRLHLLCGPLPSAIKHDCHIHSLTLLDSLIEDDFGEYYCDVCKTQRDPRIRIYHCNDCKYFAHVHCVMSALSRFDAADFETLIKEFGYSEEKRLELRSSDLGMKMVKVKGYMIPYPLAGVLQTLLDQYGDIAHPINFISLEMKSFAFFILCQTVKRMRATLVKDLLQQWYLHLDFVRWQRFNISFAGRQFETLVDAYLGLQAERLEDKIPDLLKLKIAERQRKIAEIQWEIAQMQWGLEKCEEYKGPSEKSGYMKHCMEKASKSRWLYSFEVKHAHS